MIKIVTNGMGSGDWIYIKNAQDEVVFEGHRIGVRDLKRILQDLGQPAEIFEVTDEQMEEGFSV
jgi:hypothetical protein